MVSARRVAARTQRRLHRVAASIALACALAAGCSDTQDIEADLAAIERTNALTLQALNEGDVELLNAMTAENHIMMIPGRPELRGRETILEANANLISSWNIIERWSPIETIVSGDFAWQRGEFDINMTPKREGVDPIVSVGKYLHIYARQDDGAWLMIRDMFSDNGGSPAVPDVGAAVEAWAAAYNSHVPANVTARYADDAVFWGTTSDVLRDSPEAVAAYFSGLGNRPNATVSIGELRSRVFGNVAITSGTYLFSDIVDGQSVARPSRFSFVYRLDRGEWMIVDHHSSRMPAP